MNTDRAKYLYYPVITDTTEGICTLIKMCLLYRKKLEAVLRHRLIQNVGCFELVVFVGIVLKLIYYCHRF